MEKHHYFSLSFAESTYTQAMFTSTTIRNIRKFVSFDSILTAKWKAGVSEDAVMLSCCYLGHMTYKEAFGKEED